MEANDDSNPTVEHNYPSPRLLTNRKKKKKKKKTIHKYAPSTSSSSSSSSSSIQRLTHVSFRRRTPRVWLGVVRRSEVPDIESIALPLGMSFAAVFAQCINNVWIASSKRECWVLRDISNFLPGTLKLELQSGAIFGLLAKAKAVVLKVLERIDVTNERLSSDYLSVICSSAVKESLANVFGDKFDCFARNFEKSFGSTLRTLRLINESSKHKEKYLSNPTNAEDSTSDETSSKSGCYRSSFDVKDSSSEVDLPTIANQNQLNIHEEVHENVQTGFLNRELVIHGQLNQLTCISPSASSVVNKLVFSTLEKSVAEQVRSNDLKTLELGLTLKKMKLKEEQLALNFDSNHLERSKLAMGISKASFKAEKFKNQLEETRHAELLKKCIDCLVAGLLIMSFLLMYGAYVHSYKRITDATSSCSPSLEETKSWWIPKPVASFNSGFHTLMCQVQVVSRMIFGVLMILVVAYLLIQRSGTSKQTMPVTFILLLLGTLCGLVGKFCVDTLGGNGYFWLFYWEVLCLLHFLSNVFTSVLFIILHGPIYLSQGKKQSTLFPYWIRRSIFYSTMLLILPLLCGLMPYASLSEWKDHFLQLVLDYNDRS